MSSMFDAQNGGSDSRETIGTPTVLEGRVCHCQVYDRRGL
jgi:hypothetical protein